jgi:hypothetical protein
VAPPDAGGSSLRPAVALAAAITVVVAAQLTFADGGGSEVTVAVWLVACGAVVVTLTHAGAIPSGHALHPVTTTGLDWQRRRTVVGASIAAVATVGIWIEQLRRPVDAGRWDLLAPWAIAMAAAVGAVLRPPPTDRRHGLAAWWRRRRWRLAEIGALFAVGLALNLPRLGTVPWTFNGDEGGFALISAEMLAGDRSDPFSTGYLGHPTMHNVLQAVAMSTGGETVAAARVASAVAGAACLPIAALVAIRLSSRRWVGLAAAVFVGTSDFALYWSRSALPNGLTILFVLVVVLLVDRGLTGPAGAGNRDGPSAATWLLVGLVVGLAQYFYFSNRLLVVVAVAPIIVAAGRHLGSERRRAASIEGARRAGLVAAGFIVAAGPQLAHYRRNPSAFNSRTRLVSVFEGDWLRAEAELLDRSQVRVLWDHAFAAGLLPVRTVPTGFYRPDVPLVGWPLAALAGIGVLLVTLRAARPRFTALAVGYWATVIGMAATTGPVDTNRWVGAFPVVCVGAAIALGGIVQVLIAAAPRRRSIVAVLTYVFVALAAIAGTARFFRDDNQVAVYSDTNTQVAEHLAREVQHVDPHATVYFSGAPRMYYRGFNNLVFRTPDVVAYDVDPPWDAASTPPTLVGSTLFVALPERTNELEVVERWYPGGRLAATLDERGEILYLSYLVTID